jgi:hypothetical protein
MIDSHNEREEETHQAHAYSWQFDIQTSANSSSAFATTTLNSKRLVRIFSRPTKAPRSLTLAGLDIEHRAIVLSHRTLEQLQSGMYNKQIRDDG